MSLKIGVHITHGLACVQSAVVIVDGVFDFLALARFHHFQHAVLRGFNAQEQLALMRDLLVDIFYARGRRSWLLAAYSPG